VNAFPSGESAFGVQGMLGNGWEWTSTEFSPFPGFEPFPFYRGYSADFFDGRHFVMKGGSARTACVHVAAHLPQLVSGSLPIYLHRISLRKPLTRHKELPMLVHAVTANVTYEFAADVRVASPSRPEGTAFEVSGTTTSARHYSR